MNGEGVISSLQFNVSQSSSINLFGYNKDRDKVLDYGYSGVGMSAIYPSTALKNQQREIKAKADTEIVHITENGWGKYVFMSEDVLERTIHEAVEEALYEKRLMDALDESRSDFEAGRSYSSKEEMLAAVSRKREALHAQA